eukprot:s436_g18.t1
MEQLSRALSEQMALLNHVLGVQMALRGQALGVQMALWRLLTRRLMALGKAMREEEGARARQDLPIEEEGARARQDQSSESEDVSSPEDQPRSAALLMAALPHSLKEEVISSKSVTTLGILTKAMIQYQPGGLSERSAILSALVRAHKNLRRLQQPAPSCANGCAGKGARKKLESELSIVVSPQLAPCRHNAYIGTGIAQDSEDVLAELEQVGCLSRKKEPLAGQPKLKKLEETPRLDEKQRPKGKPQEEFETKRKPCRYFLSEAGCRRGRGCPSGHLLDIERRCWTCGGRNRVSTQCPTLDEQKPRACPQNHRQGLQGGIFFTREAEVMEPGRGDESMKSLLDEASRMLRSMNEKDIKEKRQSIKDSDQKIQALQRQLDELKKASLRPFRISKLSPSTNKGLLDSGATQPLRAKKKGERLHHLPKGKVTLAGDKAIYMPLTPRGVIVGEEETEPIVPIGLLTTVLGVPEEIKAQLVENPADSESKEEEIVEDAFNPWASGGSGGGNAEAFEIKEWQGGACGTRLLYASVSKVGSQVDDEASSLPFDVGNEQGAQVSESEEEEWKRRARVQRLVEEEMVEAMDDEKNMAGVVLDSVAKIKELMGPDRADGILQTRTVSQSEVRRNIEEWRGPIKKELMPLFETKWCVEAGVRR